jgi:hypothetical protein
MCCGYCEKRKRTQRCSACAGRAHYNVHVAVTPRVCGSVTYDLTWISCAKRFVRIRLGKEFSYAEEAI